MPLQIGLADALRSAGLRVTEEPGWKTRGSPSFDPRGVLCHHTAIDSDSASIRVCRDGRPDLPGPLCQIVLLKDGTAHVLAAGRASHAGSGGWKGLSGNSSVWGVEAVHKGTADVPWPQVQLDAYYTVCAVLAKFSGFSFDYVAAHREWTTRKIDPVSLNMYTFRSRVAEELHRITEVLPMFNPPLSIAAWTRVDYGGGGLVAVSPDGHIYAEPATLYIDAPASHPEYFSGHAPAVRIYSVPGGYEVEDHHGHRYKYVR